MGHQLILHYYNQNKKINSDKVCQNTNYESKKKQKKNKKIYQYNNIKKLKEDLWNLFIKITRDRKQEKKKLYQQQKVR